MTLPATDERALDRAEIAAQLRATPILLTAEPVVAGAILHVVSVGDGSVSALDVSHEIRRERDELAARLAAAEGEIADYARTVARLRTEVERMGDRLRGAMLARDSA